MEHRAPKTAQAGSRMAILKTGVSNRVGRRNWITWESLNPALGGAVLLKNKTWERPGDWTSRHVEKNVRCVSTERQLAGANLAHRCDDGVIR